MEASRLLAQLDLDLRPDLGFDLESCRLLRPPGIPSAWNWVEGDVRDAAQDGEVEPVGSFVPGR